jgi:hypothetical protein
VKVTVITNAYQRAYARDVGEPVMCDELPMPPVPLDATSCRWGRWRQPTEQEPHLIERVKL